MKSADCLQERRRAEEQGKDCFLVILRAFDDKTLKIVINLDCEKTAPEARIRLVACGEEKGGDAKPIVFRRRGHGSSCPGPRRLAGIGAGRLAKDELKPASTKHEAFAGQFVKRVFLALGLAVAGEAD